MRQEIPHICFHVDVKIVEESVKWSVERYSDLSAGMVDERILKYELGVFDSVEHHFVEKYFSTGIKQGAGDGQRTGEGEVRVQKH